jgi:hypothetical protein
MSPVRQEQGSLVGGALFGDSLASRDLDFTIVGTVHLDA